MKKSISETAKKIDKPDRNKSKKIIESSLVTKTFAQSFLENLYFLQGTILPNATKNDIYMAMAYTVRGKLMEKWIGELKKLTELKKKPEDVKIICYLSAEFLPGPHLGNNLINLGLYDEAQKAMSEFGYDLKNIIDQEEEPGLGNGGLGRLASCYLDSLAALNVPAIGYGIRYEFGIFDQRICDGWQAEITDKWLQYGNPWEITRPQFSVRVKLGGYTKSYCDQSGKYKVNWIPHRMVKGVPYDTPIIGYKSDICNTMRLWRAEAIESFDFQDFNKGDYYAAVEEKVVSETISKVLYPNDVYESGKKLRLIQQYFFVACTLHDMFRIYIDNFKDLGDFHKVFAIQLNDTHPSIGVAELMRILVDDYEMDWDKAWDVTQKTFSFTNHTLMPEALEKWQVDLFKELLPRHLEIIYEINRRFLEEVSVRFAGDTNKIANLSVIDESDGKFVRMANLAVLGSHAVNGVSELHSQLVKDQLMNDFYRLQPDKFLNITNGVTQRRWLALSNPSLARLISESIGEQWLKNLYELKKLESFAQEKSFQKQWRNVTLESKKFLAAVIKKRAHLDVNPESMFDIQVKRIHEYKRQHLNILHVITLYNRLKSDPDLNIAPRTVIFGGKAAPGYFMAKLIIKLINSVADVINKDKDIKDKLKVVFLPDFNVKYGQNVYPAADLSEQISTAGKEASGTGNMKFALNGALTIGTYDGANIEIRQEVGEENFFLFGLTSDKIADLKPQYKPAEYYESDPELKKAIDQLSSGYFSNADRSLFKPLVDSLINNDEFMLFADYKSYIDCQDKVCSTFMDPERWTKMSILNVARMGKFSSDRAIKEYCDKIWNVKPIKI